MRVKGGLSTGRKSIVLLSGGIDSATCLYVAIAKGYSCHCLIFDYGQRHRREVEAAKKIAKVAKCRWRVIKFSLPWRGSSLLDKRIPLPHKSKLHSPQIPSTYVPARNTIFLSFALSFAEGMGTEAIFIGANSIDYSGYPDCRPEYYRAFRRIMTLGTKMGTEGRRIEILTPLIRKTKAEIIRTGTRLGVPFQFTWSCYKGGRRPCGMCDSCLLRAKGFREAGIKDPLLARS